MDASEISPLAILLAAVSMFVIGGAWYSGLFAAPWRRATGLSEERVRSGAGRVFAGSAVLSLVVAASMAAFIGSAPVTTGVLIGAVAGLTFAAAPLWIVGLFERRPVALALIDGGYVLVAFTVMGAIVAALQ